MHRPFRGIPVLCLIVAAAVLTAPPLGAQKIDEAKRIQNREQLLTVLRTAEETTHLTFVRSNVNPFNFSAFLRVGLQYAESVEVVMSVTDVDTIAMQAYPKYKGTYINVDRARDPLGLMRQVLKLSGRTFLHWGTDDSGDIFYGFTFTMESGFPSASIPVALRSVQTHDQFLKELLPALE